MDVECLTLEEEMLADLRELTSYPPEEAVLTNVNWMDVAPPLMVHVALEYAKNPRRRPEIDPRGVMTLAGCVSAHNERDIYRGDLTIDQWLAVRGAYQHRCAYCQTGGLLQIEHIKPVSTGGRSTILNIAPACRRCNASKRAKPLEKWLGKRAAAKFLSSHVDLIESLDGKAA